MIPKSKTIEIKQGFFPTFIYLQINQQLTNQIYYKQLQQILVQNQISFLKVQPFHISLTKTFYPLINQIQSILNLSKKVLSLGIVKLPIILLFKQVQILQNFITLSVQRITEQKLKPIIKQFEKITKNEFYETPVFHVSLFKIQSQISIEVLNQLLSVRLEPKKSLSISKCKMKSGKVVYDLNK